MDPRHSYESGDAGSVALQFDLSLPYGQRGGRLRPLVRIGIQFRDGPFQITDALVDTGADVCVLDGSLALDAGLDPTRDPIQVLTIAGFAGAAAVQAYVQPVTLYVGTASRFRALVTDVAFADPAVPLRVGILGHQGFLDRLRFAIDGTMIPPRMYVGFPE